MKRILFILLTLTLTYSCKPNENEPIIDNPSNGEMYFPPVSGQTWETETTASLGWNENKLNDLYTYLDEKNTKGFIILKDGRIVIEKYFNNHTRDKNWQWFSAAKSLTAVGMGIAQDENLIDIDKKTSEYLGNNWSSLPKEKQDLITVKNHLMMNTGLKNNSQNLLEWSCTLPKCLTFSNDANTTWEYNQGAFILAQDILTKSVEGNFKTYLKTKVLDKIGMNGGWTQVTFINIFSSTTRSMARFGLLALNKGKWNNEIILSESYFNEMTTTSQNQNKAYGYLWWLNGKSDFIGTDSKTYQGSLIPNAQNDMIAALGARDQKIYVVPSKGLVIVRCGDDTGNQEFASSSFDNELWGKINEVIN